MKRAQTACRAEATLMTCAPRKNKTTPSGTNMDTMPSTKAPESSAPWRRLFTCFAPNTLTVTATIG